MTDTPEEWQASQRRAWDEVAPGWFARFGVLDAAAGPVNEHLVATAGVRPGHRVLDVATGVGEPALTAARHVGPAGRVLAVDLSPVMLEHAAARARAAGLANIEWLERDAEELGLDPGSFDAALCRWGVMLMRRPERCVRGVRAALVGGARFAACVWSTPDEVPFMALARSVAERHADLAPFDPDAPGPLRMGRVGQLEQVFEEAGFTDLERATLDVPIDFERPADFLGFLKECSSTFRRLTRELPDAAAAALEEDLLATAAREHPAPGGGLSFANRVHCVSGRA